jgi:hypothetical protein
MRTLKKDRDRRKTSTVSLTQNEITVESEKKFFENDNNYIDYFMEVGVKPEIFRNNFLYESKTPEEITENLIPQIICKFPVSDKRNIVVENVMVNQIFPHGFKVKESKTKPKSEFYCVVLDNQLYSAIYTRKYLACLVIYESIDSYSRLNDKYKLEDNKFMVVLRSTMKQSRPKEMSIDHNKKKLKQWFIPKCLCIVSVHPYINKYEEILTNIYDLIMSNKQPYLSLFLDHIIEKMIVETPRVPRGLKKVILRFPNKDIDISEKKMNEMPSVNVDYCRMFDILSINNVIEIFKYLLYETKLMFFCQNLTDLTNTIISFLCLLAPFKYQFQIVSVLSKELYSYAETISPFIFGINEKYTDNFFTKNKISIEETTICVVDIDNDVYYLIAPDGQIDYKDNPEFPKKLKKKWEERLKKNSAINYYYNKNDVEFSTNNNEKIKTKINIEKNEKEIDAENDKKERNVRYQSIFFKIMIDILKDYPKYLSKDYSVSKDISMSIKDMIDIKSYLNSFGSPEKYFYSKIFATQMFMEFIYKRMMPKNCNEKVEVLFFEEKIKEKSSSKKIFGKSKLLDQNVLLTCKDYDFEEEPVIIDLKQNKDLTDKLNTYFLDRKNYILKDCLTKGFSILLDEERKKSTFYYYLFPPLFSDKLFILNAESYKAPDQYYEKIEKIDMKIVNKSYLKFIQNIQTLKNSEAENDLYLCYLIIWSLTMWYTEEKEREYRFYEMLSVLKKVEEHEIKIFEILFKNLVEYSEDKNVILLYKIFIHLRLNPSWEMFSLVSKIIKKKQNASNKKNLLHQDIDPQEIIKKYRIDKKLDSFHQRSLKSDNSEDFIFSNALTFYAYFKCEKCKSSLNIYDICAKLSNFDKNKIPETHKYKTKFKEEICEKKYESKLRFRFGEELFYQKIPFNLIYKRKTSIIKEIQFLFPTELKQRLLQIVSDLNKKDKLDVELLRYNYPDVFWSLIFYFDLNDIDKTFMLPYTYFDANTIFEDDLSKNVEYINSKKEDNLNVIDLNLIKDFNLKNYILPKKNGIKKYDTDNLCIQNVYNLGLIKNILYTYKNIFSYEENIDYNELPVIIFEKENTAPAFKRVSSIMIDDNESCSSFIQKDKLLPLNKRNSDSNIMLNYSLRMPKVAGIPEDAPVALKGRNPLDDRIFNFESSDDDNSDEEEINSDHFLTNIKRVL